MRVHSSTVNRKRPLFIDSPADCLRERFRAQQRKVIAEHTAAGRAVVILDAPDWVLSAIHDERTLKAIARAYTRPILD
jgi:hypothetical protein